MRKIQSGFILVLLFLSLLLPTCSVAAKTQDSAPLVIVATADGPLTPAMANYLERAIGYAQDAGADLIVLQLNTPGGSIDLMNRMVQDIRESPVPVVVYIAPRGAMAGSAGTLITLAGHAAAMAPETTIGAASPVGSQGEDIGETMEAKVKSILKATARTLAERRGPEAVAVAEDTIENARAVTSSEALEVGLVDVVADSTTELLEQLDGMTVEVLGEESTLHLQNAVIDELEPSLIELILDMLTDPNVVFLLLTLGVQAILIELSSPGGWVAGFIGAVCVLLAIYGLGILPVNWFGVIFLVVAFVLFALEVKAPTHGALTIAGIASFIVGALVLFNSLRVPGFPLVSVPLVIGTAIFIALSFSAIVTFALRAQKGPLRMGKETYIARTGTARTPINPRGMVQVAGEQWSALLEEDGKPIEEGARVEVVAVEGVRLIVRQARPESPATPPVNPRAE